MASTDLLYRFLGIDAGAGAQFDRMGAKTAALGETSAVTSGKVAALAKGAALSGVVIGVASIKMASDYQRAMTLIQTQAGASKAEVESFSKSLLGLAGKVGKSPEDLATSLYHVYSTGLRGAEALRAVKIAAEGAQIGNADLEETTNALTSTIASGIKGAGDYAAAMGKLNAIVGAGDMKLSDLNDALGSGILAAARVFNVSLTQVGAALAVFGDNNIRGADAATKLRMVIQDLAKPAANADDTLSQIGLTSDELRSKLENHGLTAALTDLKTHMDAAGITAGKVGPFIEQAFTKKAGVGLGILIEQMGRYNQKLVAVGEGGKNFGSDWSATTKTFSFAFAKMRAEVDSLLIQLGTKLLPIATDVVNWFGKELPHALSTLGHVLGPVVHGLGDVLHALGPVLPVAERLAPAVLAMWAAFEGYQIARFAVFAVADGIAVLQGRAAGGLSSMRVYGAGMQATLAGNATEAQLTSLIMQAAFAETAAAAEAEAAAVATAGAEQATAWAAMVAASDTATASMILGSEGMAAAAQAAAATAVASAAELAASAEAAAAAVDEAGAVASVGWKAMLGPLAAVGIGVALLTTMFGGNSEAAAQNAQDVESLTAALDKDGGAVRGATKDWIAHKLVTDGVYDNLGKLGLSYDTVTSAVMGNKNALGEVRGALNANLSGILNGGLAATKAAQEILRLSGALGLSKKRYWELQAALVAIKQPQRDAAESASRNADALGNLAAGSHTVTDAQTKQKTVTISLTDSLAKLRDTYLKTVNALLGLKQSQLQFLDSLHSMKQAIDASKGSLSEQSVKGRAAQEALLSAAQGAQSMADGTRKSNLALLSNIESLRQQAIHAGVSKGEVDKLLHSMGLMPRQIRTMMHIETAQANAALDSISQKINGIVNGYHQVTLTVVEHDGTAHGNAGASPRSGFGLGARFGGAPDIIHKYGITYIENTINGAKHYIVSAQSVAREIAIGFLTGWKDGSAKLLDALPSPVQRALERMTKIAQSAIAKQAAILKKAQDNLKSDLKARASAISSLASNLSGDLSGIFGTGTDMTGNSVPVTANVNTYLGGQRKQLESFAKDLKWAAHHGVSNALLSEIAGLGAVQGDEVLQQFISGAASITAANRAEAAIKRYSKQSATLVEDRMYAKHLTEDRREVREQTGELRKIRHLMEKEERHLARQISTHLTIDAKTGQPTVDKKFIDDIMKGIKRAERLAGKKLV